MERSFSGKFAETVFARRRPASGLDEETVHRIRTQVRIERAKVIRRGFALLARTMRTARSRGRLNGRRHQSA